MYNVINPKTKRLNNQLKLRGTLDVKGGISQMKNIQYLYTPDIFTIKIYRIPLILLQLKYTKYP